MPAALLLDGISGRRKNQINGDGRAEPDAAPLLQLATALLGTGAVVD
jgi:hypothetical protein